MSICNVASGRSFRFVFVCVLVGLISWPLQARDLYVRTGGTHADPYTSPETAASNVLAAVAVAVDGDTIHVADGVWTGATGLSITNGITIEGENGPGAASLQWTAGITINHADAVLSALSVVFNANTYITLTGGTITNCWVRDKVSRRYPALFIGANGLVTHSKIYNNSTISGLEKNSGVQMTGGVLQYSIVSNNTTAANSSGIYLQSGTPVVRNCLIVNNRSFNYPGGGIYIANNVAATIESCTVAHNSGATASTCGGIYSAATAASGLKHTVSNTVVYGNLSGTLASDTGGGWSGHTNAYAFSCAPELPAGVNGNLADDSSFMAPDEGNFRLRISSPCIDAGSNQAWMVTDVDGASRVVAFRNPGTAIVDMGCYERAASLPGDPLEVSLSCSHLTGRTSQEVTFTPFVAGGDTNVAWYGFDFEGDGEWDVQEAGQPLPASVVRTLAVGEYPVVFVASNASGDRAESILATPIVVHPLTYYLAPVGVGSNTAPYDTSAKAATNFNVLVTYAMGADEDETVVVEMADGLHINNFSTQIEKALSVRGSGPENVTLRIGGGNFNRLTLGDARSVLEGVTLIEDGTPNYGLLVVGSGAIASNCVIRSYSGYDSVIKTSGLLTHSLIYSNTCTQGGAETLGGIWVGAGGVVENCRIFNNASGKAGGAIQLASTGVVRNSLIYNNQANGTGGGGVYAQGAAAGALVESCTIAGNRCNNSQLGGGIFSGTTALAVTNTIIYGNSRIDTTVTDVSGDTNCYGYSCAPEIGGDTFNLTADPLLTLENGHYLLSAESPCINAGMPKAMVPGWMSGAFDLVGMPRVSGPAVDMGAYEYQSPRGTFILIR